MGDKGVNPDLVKERQKCTFNIQELVHLIDGGEQATRDRKEVEELVLAIKDIRDKVPEEYLSHKERYENAVRKTVMMVEVLKDHALKHSSFDAYKRLTHEAMNNPPDPATWWN